jgi:ABC-type sugar transport system permease subunit
MKTRSLSGQRAREGFVFTLPWIIGFLAFVAWPLGYSLFLSFQRVNSAGFSTVFIGLGNYTRAFTVDMKFGPALLSTLGSTLVNVPVVLVFSLAVAVLLNRALPARAVVRALFFLPVVIGSGYVMQELFNQGVGGVSVALGVQGQAGAIALPSGGVATATHTTSAVNVSAYLGEFLGPQMTGGINEFLNKLGLALWRSGIQIILFLAGLQGISRSLYEAGRIDGANEWTLFWSVTFPIISPIMVAVVIFSIVDSFTDVFNPILEMIRSQAFVKLLYGYSAALSWIYFLVIFAVILVFLALVSRRVFTRGEK